MELVKPAIGLVFWMCVTFSILVFILAKFAWKPILTMIKEREQAIENSLNEANKARNEMSQLVAKNEELLNQAKEERNQILHDAKEAAERVKADIVARAQKEAEEKIQMAFREIEIQKKAAIVEVKNAVGTMALEIAEKVIRKELKSNTEHVEYVNKLAKESNLN
ncbi:MAG TPA: F0F1 ATP synthase subunit B [Chitinophagales bacterium]|nr:F0F1 ATP synthase subunit B [Chitinophagales bacterium]HLP51263.1 F0F1 ATP synthase subunit B [Chitinophagales bacterium]